MFINSNVAGNFTVTASVSVSVSVINCPSVRGIVIRTVNGFVFCPSVPSVDALEELRPKGTSLSQVSML